MVNIFTVTIPSLTREASWSAVEGSQTVTHACSALSHRPWLALARWACATSAGACPGRGMAKSTIVVVPPNTAAVVHSR